MPDLSGSGALCRSGIISPSYVAVGRAWARRVGHRRWLDGLGDMVRRILRCRAVSYFVGQAMKLRELFDRAFDRNRIDKIGEAGCRLLLDAIEAAGGAIALKGSNVSGEAGLIEEPRHLFQR